MRNAESSNGDLGETEKIGYIIFMRNDGILRMHSSVSRILYYGRLCQNVCNTIGLLCICLTSRGGANTESWMDQGGGLASIRRNPVAA
jgi:hypothetical protein